MAYYIEEMRLDELVVLSRLEPCKTLKPWYIKLHVGFLTPPKCVGIN